MSSPTPGPWSVVRGMVRAEKEQRYDSGSFVLTTSMIPVADCIIKDGGTLLNGDWEANARLIAAAPDLLEALRDMTFDEFGAPTCWPNQERVMALIAKAEGK